MSLRSFRRSHLLHLIRGIRVNYQLQNNKCLHIIGRINLIQTFQSKIMKMMLIVACFIGIAAATADADNVESLTVSEGGNLTISIHIKKWDEDPQVLVSRLKGSSQQLIAQITCHNRVCERECLISGVSLMSDEENVTLILMNVSFSQTGLYKVCKLGDTQPENKIYQVTVCKPPPYTVSPEQPPPAIYSKSFTAGVTTSALRISVVITAIIGVFS